MPKVSPEVEWTPEDREVERRRDLRRSHTVMSIDPRGCTDVDDTLSVKHLSNGNVELGVHIADVTHFVKQDSLTGRRTRKKNPVLVKRKQNWSRDSEKSLLFERCLTERWTSTSRFYHNHFG